MTGSMPYVAVAVLFLCGLYMVLFEHNLFKIALGITVMEASANLFLVVLGYRSGGGIPVYTLASRESMVLPTPQALTLTAIVIGLATTALLLSLVVWAYRHYGTLDIQQIRRLRG